MQARVEPAKKKGLPRPFDDHAVLAMVLPDEFRMLIHKVPELPRFQQLIELLVHVFMARSTTHPAVMDPRGVEGAGMSCEDCPQKCCNFFPPYMWRIRIPLRASLALHFDFLRVNMHWQSLGRWHSDWHLVEQRLAW